MYQRYNPLLPASENPPLPSMETYLAILEEARLWAQSVGYKEEDVAEVIKEVRREKRERERQKLQNENSY
ncbi:MAG: hypothetical protein IJM82_04470 [Synergistaceae bacterium]|nr:hypothetical protein [Synergistaceae bacterium]MBQ7068399.1 hypothetical protein [Synergistaceae bacterium]MBR0233729.1 hypothetical protein [Synergistaceae bacterium]MBR0316664.1 hypothetical protein [Synergistaceae bacterium]